MRKNVFILSLALTLIWSTANSGTPDPRFEGVWVGTETYASHINAVHHSAFEPARMTAMIAIADGGKTFGVIQGLGPGRYDASPKSDGNKLFFKSVLSGTGRTSCTFVLSPDGNTLTETGFGLYPAKPYAIDCEITGTLHRRSKK